MSERADRVDEEVAPRTADRRVVLVLLAVVVPVGAVAALVPFRESVASANLALVLVTVVLLMAIVGGRVAGIIAAVTTALAFDLLLTRPFNSFQIATSADVQTFVLLLVIGMIAGELVERARRSTAAAIAVRRSLDSLYQHAEIAAGTDSPGRLIRIVSDELTELLGLSSCMYRPGSLPSPMPILGHRSILVKGDVPPEALGHIALPVRSHGALQGHLVMELSGPTGRSRISIDQRHAAVALADQLGIGLLRFRDGTGQSAR
jgi:hypothetical protein